MKLTYFVRVCEGAMAAFRHEITSKNIVFCKKKPPKNISERKRKSKRPTVWKERNQEENIKTILP